MPTQQIVLISLIEDVSIPGLRYLSAYLRSKGLDVKTILLPWQFTDMSLNEPNSFLYPYPEKVLKQLAEKSSDGDLIGISLMTNHFDNAVHITNYLHKQLPAKPVIWGGIHPTISPKECLEYADFVCVGEAEKSLYQLTDELKHGQEWKKISIPGIYHKVDTRSFLAGPIFENIDELPLPLYSTEDTFILYKGEIVPLQGEVLKKCLFYYRTLLSRGCPYACTYCCNNTIQRIYSSYKILRWRNLANMIKELKETVNQIPHIEKIIIADDSFLTRPLEVIAEFASEYKESVGLPFEVLSIPKSVTEEKIKLLLDAGLSSIGIGVQSGSQRISRDLYRRPEKQADILRADQCIKASAKKIKKKILIRYDFILDNPWETGQDVVESIELALKLRKSNYGGVKYNFALFSLCFYPGTELYEKAKNDGLIKDEINQIYRNSQLIKNNTYLNSVFSLVSCGVPDWLIRIFLSKKSRELSLVKTIRLLEYIFLGIRLGKAIIRGDEKHWDNLFSRICSRINIASLRKRDKVVFSGRPGEY